MFGTDTDRYDEPVGPWGQRVAGLVLLVFLALATWYAVTSLVGAGRVKKPTADPLWYSLMILAAAPWLATIGFRLVAARMNSAALLPPAGLVAAGTVILVGMIWWASSLPADAPSTSHGRAIVGGVLTGLAAIGVGLRRHAAHRHRDPDA